MTNRGPLHRVSSDEELDDAHTLWHAHAKLMASKYGAIISLAIIAGCVAASYFISQLTIESNPEKIWVPPSSSTAQQQGYFNSAFGNFYRVNQIIVSPAGPPARQPVSAFSPLTGYRAALRSQHPSAARDCGSSEPAPAQCQAENILQPGTIRAMLDMQHELQARRATSYNVTLDDLCFKPIRGEGCIIESPTNYIASSAAVAQQLTQAELDQLVACLAVDKYKPYITKPCYSAIGSPVMPAVVLGQSACCPSDSVSADICSHCLTQANAVMLTLLLRDDASTTEAAAAWEQEVFLPIAEAWGIKVVQNNATQPLRASYMAQRSLQDEISVVASRNKRVVIASYIGMFGYMALAMGRVPHPVHSKVLVAAASLLGVCVAVVSALGLMALAGQPITLIVTEVVPFLALAIGVDNTMVLLRAIADVHARVGTRAPVALRLGHALRQAGDGICAAAISEFSAFLVGIAVDIPALMQFSMAAALTVAINFILQMTVLVSLLAADMHREDVGRADVCPCCVRVRPAPQHAPLCSRVRCVSGCRSGICLELRSPDLSGAWSPATSGASERLLDPALSSHEMHEYASRSDRELFGSQSSSWAATRACLRGGYVRTVMTKAIAPAALSKPGIVLGLVLWLGTLGAGIYGATQLPMGMPQQLVVPKDSYLETYFNDQAALGDAGPPAYIVLPNLNMSHPDAEGGVMSLVMGSGALYKSLLPTVYAWLPQWHSYVDNAAEVAAANCAGVLPLASSAPPGLSVHRWSTGVRITSKCCQLSGFCGGQYMADVVYAWAPLDVVMNSSTWAPAFDDPDILAYAYQVAYNSPSTPKYGYIPVDVAISRLRAQHTPVRNQSDFIRCMQDVQNAIPRLAQGLPVRNTDPAALGLPSSTPLVYGATAQGSPSFEQLPANVQVPGEGSGSGALAFAYSLFYVYYEQYNYIRPVALTVLALAAASVAAMSAATLQALRAAALSVLMTLSVAVGMVAGVWLTNPAASHNPEDPFMGVSTNAVSVVNLCAAIGLGVEFVVHIIAAFLQAAERHTARQEISQGIPKTYMAPGHSLNEADGWRRAEVEASSSEAAGWCTSGQARVLAARKALVERGSAVVSGITLTKLVGVLLLATAPSELFRVYYFRMYLALCVSGAIHSVWFLPAVLAVMGPLPWPSLWRAVMSPCARGESSSDAGRQQSQSVFMG